MLESTLLSYRIFSLLCNFRGRRFFVSNFEFFLLFYLFFVCYKINFDYEFDHQPITCDLFTSSLKMRLNNSFHMMLSCNIHFYYSRRLPRRHTNYNIICCVRLVVHPSISTECNIPGAIRQVVLTLSHIYSLQQTVPYMSMLLRPTELRRHIK